MTIQPNVWTQVNTNVDKFLIQNLSIDEIYLIASSNTPLPTAKADLILERCGAVSDVLANKIFWAKTSEDREAEIGILE